MLVTLLIIIMHALILVSVLGVTWIVIHAVFKRQVDIDTLFWVLSTVLFVLWMVELSERLWIFI